MLRRLTDTRNMILGLDIGATQVCATIASIDGDDQINIQGVGTSVTAGLGRGKVTDTEQLIKSIRRAVSRAERSSQNQALLTIVNVSGSVISTQDCHGLYKSNEANGQISADDKLKVIKKARLLVQKPQKKMVHFIPIHFRVDENVSTKDPVGIFGKLLEVDALGVLCDEAYLEQLIQVVQGSGLEVGGICLNSLATSEVILTKEEKQAGAILLDFGGGNVHLAYFKEGVMRRSAVVPMGGEQITKDIAYCLKVNQPEAERLKVVFGCANTAGIPDSERIEIIPGNEEPREIYRKYLCQIVEARCEEVIRKIKAEIQQFALDSNEPTVLVMTGGGLLLKGLSDQIRKAFPSFEIREGLPPVQNPIIESQAYAPSLGLLLYGMKHNIVKHLKASGKLQLNAYLEKAKTLVRDLF